MANIRETSTSRLVKNSENIRDKLNTRNIYGIDVQYPQKSDSVSNKILDSVNAISQILTPYSGYDLRNTVFGRSIEDRTPLTEIGLIMLGKQFAMNSIKRAANDTIPIIKPSNLLPWRTGNLFTSRKDLSITREDRIGGFQQFLENTIHFYPMSKNPFSKNPTNKEYLENTGKAQLDFLYKNINNNLFVNNEISIFAGDAVPPRNQNLTHNKLFFTKGGGRRNDFHPYTPLNYLSVLKSWEIEANLAMRESLEYLADSYPDYGADLNYIENVLGGSEAKATTFDKTNLSESNDKFMNGWIDTDTGFIDDFLPNKIVWGRDGITTSTDTELSQLRGIEENSLGDTSNMLKDKFDVRSGLLEYTRNLINANGGHVGDITRKVFTEDGKIAGFNGSALWQAPSTALERFRNKKGLRQHSVLDQYGSFAKAIRFDGNQVYNGNPNSVVYKSVLPKIHPIVNDDGKVDARNMMFSIENLAVKVNESGMIDDEYGTVIPEGEVGAFGGRVMWFPPYNLEFNETHNANYESTVMVGRNEPMYNYLHSERAGTIRFSLIIDYPPQISGYLGLNKHKELSEFFAFGGYQDKKYFNDFASLEFRKFELQKRLQELSPAEKIIQTLTPNENELRVSFPNDIPAIGNDNSTTIFDENYELGYEINKKINVYGGTSYGINSGIYYPMGIENNLGVWEFNPEDIYTSQYTFNPKNSGDSSQLNVTQNLISYNNYLYTKLDYILLQAFENEENRKLLRIKVEAGASKLYYDQGREESYNFELGKRRANALKNLINSRLKVLFGKDATGLGIQFNLGGENSSGSYGSTYASVQNATVDRINAEDTKKERFAVVLLEKTSYVPQSDDLNLTPEEVKEKEALQEELEKITTLISQLKKKNYHGVFREKIAENQDLNLEDTGKLNGFSNIAQNYYAPAFHSQTPEDFHRRLTFLNQCMRQGAAKKYEVELDDNGTARARNSVFGRQPICILRIADFFHTKIIIENLTIDYDEAPWDTNPEGFGMQPMIANITLNIKIMGGQSLRGPINALQNAVTFNYYANSTFSNKGLYKTPSYIAAVEEANRLDINIKNEEGKLLTYQELQDLIEVKNKRNASSE